jgi:general secretion pathway protein G
MQSATPRNTRRRGGFTLIEVLLVLAILGVIAAMVVPNLLGQQKKAMVNTTRSSIHGLETSLQAYAVDHDGELPTGGTEEMFSMLSQPKDRDGNPMKDPYIDKRPVDAWNQPLNYRYPATKQNNSTKADIWSSGPNKQNEDGGGDDINNWTQTTVK